MLVVGLCEEKKKATVTFWGEKDETRFVINDVITFVHKHSNIPLAHLHVKISDHMSNRYQAISKNVTFHLNMYIEGWLCRHAVTSSVTS